VHARRLVREGIEQAQAAAEPHSDLLRLAETAVARAFGLARVGQAVTVPTREQVAASVEDGDPLAAISAVRIHRTDEPWPAPAERAPRAIRDQIDSLLDEAAKRELTLREALAFLVEREVARKDERRIEMASIEQCSFVRSCSNLKTGLATASAWRSESSPHTTMPLLQIFSKTRRAGPRAYAALPGTLAPYANVSEPSIGRHEKLTP
jgi:hypothetical protein